MARPTKQGIDYFPLDVVFDDKVELYLIETGADGLAVLITLWQMIYSNNGYFVEDSPDLSLLVKRRISIEIDRIKVCITAALNRGIFDLDQYHDNHIFTSRAIQKRFFDAARKKKAIEVCRDYIINGVSDGNNWVYVAGNATKGKGKGKVNVEVKGEVKGKVIQPNGCIGETSKDDSPGGRVPVKQIQTEWNQFAERNALPQCVKMTTALSGQIRQRWREDLPGLDRWSNYLDFISQSDFLMGKAEPRPGKRPFRATLAWITKAGNYAKIAAREYHE